MQKEKVKNMALNIVKSPAFSPCLMARYHGYAMVETEKKKGLQKFFGLRAGSVFLSQSQDSDISLIRVIPPVWKKGLEDEWETLQQCYEQVLQLAAEHHCKAVFLPLLTEDDPKFPAYIDFKLAVDTANAFLKDHNMDIHLLARRREAFQTLQLRKDMERYLSRNPEEDLPWSSQPFAGGQSRFNTMAPCPPNSAGRIPPPPPAKAARRMDLPLPSLDHSSPRPSRYALDALLRNTDAGFSETLLKLIDQSGKKDSEIYNKANVSRQHFSKIRNNPDYRPTKPTAIAFAIALELDLEQTRDLIGRAGYTLSDSLKFDKIIMFFIQRRIYNMFDINEALFEYDQMLLGS